MNAIHFLQSIFPKNGGIMQNVAKLKRNDIVVNTVGTPALHVGCFVCGNLPITSLERRRLYFHPCWFMHDDVIIFRVIGPSWKEFTGHQLFPLAKASDAETWCFF